MVGRFSKHIREGLETDSVELKGFSPPLRAPELMETVIKRLWPSRIQADRDMFYLGLTIQLGVCGKKAVQVLMILIAMTRERRSMTNLELL